MSSHDMRIVIVGAGVGGLTLALLLRRRGYVAEVVEQAPELREKPALPSRSPRTRRGCCDSWT